MAEELEISVGGNFLHNVTIENDFLALVLVYTTSPGQVITKSALHRFRSEVLDQDDVFRAEFFSNIVFFGAKEKDLRVERGALNEFDDDHVKSQTFVAGDAFSDIAPGPYVFTRGRTWQPWRIYFDTNVPVDKPLAGIDGRVVVPSRCYFKPSKDRPLDGARISIKDSIDIAGHKTSLCNRAWNELYPPRTETAACVQTLIDAGAIIVGKVKLMAMIMREEPLECVEFTAPFNPRADGYQVPSGSSHGSAAGISSYDWLDFSVGSDTNGSGRKPASYNGCFSIRPTTGIMNVDGVVAFFPQFDMPVFFGRDISRFTDFISVWYGDSPMLRPPSQTRFKIVYPRDYLPTPNPQQSLLIENFVTGLESALGIKRVPLSIAELWRREVPDGEEYDDVAAYLETAGIYPFYYDQYHNLADFRNEYQEKFGKPPFVHRALHWQWDVAKSVSKEERDECLRRCEVYRDWLLKRVFKADDENCITIMPLPIEVGKPNYRDSKLPPESLLPGFSALHMSPIMRAPEVTAPEVTKREEPLPIAVSVIGAPGTDLIITEVVQKGLEASGLGASVETGRKVYRE
ncbi:amidase [Colletotrichum sublineola]|nr:amidase [Colletotrichum sublineola]